jgi:hypothetical protein
MMLCEPTASDVEYLDLLHEYRLKIYYITRKQIIILLVVELKERFECTCAFGK